MLNLPERFRLAYRALIHTPTRPLPSPAIVTSDQELNGSKRKLSFALARDLEQNFAIASWAVDQHLTYTSDFNFQARTPDMGFNAELEAYFAERTSKKRFDLTGRMSISDMCRAFMASKIWDGDGAILKTSSGLLQLLEAWQITNASGAPESVTPEGLILDAYGRVKQYAIAVKDSTGIHFDSLAAAEHVIFDGYFKRANQTRGISPLMPVINTARDMMDATNYYLLKTKIAAMFGIVIYRDHGSKGACDFNYQTASAPSADEKKYLQYELRPGLKLELEKDEKAEFLESNTPPNEFLNFSTFLIRQILSALKIPYSMYDSNAANYSASRSDLNRYKALTSSERRQMLAVYDEITDFILRYDIRTGALKLPRSWTYDQINWEWLPTASFVIDRPSEIASYISMIDRGLTTRSNACKELGLGNFRDNAAELASEERFLREQGVTVALANPGAPVTAGPQKTANEV